MEDQLQHQRFERKYFITERQAIQIREFIRGYLVPDKFSSRQPDSMYPVHSLYLDSSEFITYWATVHCEKRRFKLRVRFYDDRPETPVFFEIKRRDNECISKRRGLVHRSVGASLLAGQLPGPEHLVTDSPAHLAAVQSFCRLSQRLNARPKVAVSYLREAWVNPDNNSVRVTIDRHVRGEPRHQAVFSSHMNQPIHPFGQKRVLELKFTDRFPDWFRQLVQRFGLLQTGVPKYCGSVAETGEELGREHPRGANRSRLAEILDFC